MKTSSLCLICIFSLVLGCSKNSSSAGGPVISIKSYSDYVPNGGEFDADLSFSQSDGNISGDSLVILRRRYNVNTTVPAGQERDTFITTLPITPKTGKADFNATLYWEDIEYGIDGDNDTCDFRFVLIDQNSKHSDTAATGKVIILQQ
jgi:hypothetical protein